MVPRFFKPEFCFPVVQDIGRSLTLRTGCTVTYYPLNLSHGFYLFASHRCGSSYSFSFALLTDIHSSIQTAFVCITACGWCVPSFPRSFCLQPVDNPFRSITYLKCCSIFQRWYFNCLHYFAFLSSIDILFGAGIAPPKYGPNSHPLFLECPLLISSCPTWSPLSLWT